MPENSRSLSDRRKRHTDMCPRSRDITAACDCSRLRMQICTLAEDLGYKPGEMVDDMSVVVRAIVEPVEVERDRLREALEEIADGYERHNPGWWIKKAKAALARPSDEGEAPRV